MTASKKAGGRTIESKSTERNFVKVIKVAAPLGQGFVVDMPLLYQIHFPGEKMD
jgi:hypothetical protein